MGHSGSVHRDRSRRQVHGERRGRGGGGGGGGLYGESTEPIENTTRYTPAQMQAMYLSRGRPDMGFMTNQQATIPREIPEMQQTITVKNHVNLKKTSLKLVPVCKEEEEEGEACSNQQQQQYNLEFYFDATKPCHLFIYLLALETIDEETGCSEFSFAHSILSKKFTQKFLPQGLGQYFNLKIQLNEILDLNSFEEKQLIYHQQENNDEKNTKNEFPLVIVLEVDDPSKLNYW
jgi:hypothetical protein